MKKLEFKTSKGEFILEEASYKNLGRVLVKYMTEEQFDDVLDRSIHTGLFAHYIKDIPVNIYCYQSGLESFESLIKSLGWNLFENPYSNFADETGCQEAESKTFYNPILLKKL